MGHLERPAGVEEVGHLERPAGVEEAGHLECQVEEEEAGHLEPQGVEGEGAGLGVELHLMTPNLLSKTDLILLAESNLSKARQLSLICMYMCVKPKTVIPAGSSGGGGGGGAAVLALLSCCWRTNRILSMDELFSFSAAASSSTCAA